MDVQVIMRLLWQRWRLHQHDRWTRARLLAQQATALHHLRPRGRTGKAPLIKSNL